MNRQKSNCLHVLINNKTQREGKNDPLVVLVLNLYWPLPSLTFPLVQRQVCVVHGLVIRQRLSLFFGISELAEKRQVEGLRGAHPLLGVQEKHLFQDAHCCVADIQS